VTERQVRFTEQFFERLDSLLPTERGADGTPSVTDFLLLDLPAVRDRLASDPHLVRPSEYTAVSETASTIVGDRGTVQPRRRAISARACSTSGVSFA
jgi:hypothetical protein